MREKTQGNPVVPVINVMNWKGTSLLIEKKHNTSQGEVAESKPTLHIANMYGEKDEVPAWVFCVEAFNMLSLPLILFLCPC